MKKEIENREDLLRSLALKGDSHAFFSLSASYFRARYLRERSTGSSHQDAQTRVLAEATELLEKLQHVPPARINAWFEEHCMIIASSDVDQLETGADRKLFAETASFLNRCSSDIMSSGSKMKRERQLRARRFPQNLFGNRIVMSLLIAGMATGFCFAAVLLMTWFNASVHISFETPNRQFSLRIPITTPITDDSTDTPPASTAIDTSETEKILKDKPQTAPAPVPSVTNTETPPPRPVASSTPQTSPTPAATRALPPVVPKARMILPPMPPQSVEPAIIPATPPGDEPVPSQTPTAPSPPLSLPPGTNPAN